VNIGDAIAAAAREGVILSGGGHAMAGGLSLEPEQLDAFDALDGRPHGSVCTAERAAAHWNSPSMPSFRPAPRSRGARRPKSRPSDPSALGAPQPVFAIQDVRLSGVRYAWARVMCANHWKFTAEDASGQPRLPSPGAPLGQPLGECADAMANARASWPGGSKPTSGTAGAGCSWT
jgi:single-stranded-DNA-specific exonuclease